VEFFNEASRQQAGNSTYQPREIFMGSESLFPRAMRQGVLNFDHFERDISAQKMPFPAR